MSAQESVPRVALVTGGSRGIGLAICRRLARDGCRIHVVYRTADDGARQALAAIEADGGSAMLHKADIASEPDVQTLVDRVLDRDGTIHVLVNNAGIIDDQLVELTSLAQWEHVLRVNLTGAFLMCRAVIPAMVDQSWGRIVNISSNSVRMPHAGQSAYVAAKGGLEALTRALAVEVGRKGIRVNAVAPGAIRTDMTAGFPQQGAGEESAVRWGTPDDVAGLVSFLASDAADYIQAQTITADGGRLVFRQRLTKRRATGQ